MNSFQVLDSNNEPIPILLLDESAAKFWNVTLHSKEYAKPNNNPLGNWFDTIGWSISKQTDYLNWGLNTWNTIKSDMLSIHVYSCVVLSPEEAGIRMCKIMHTLKPYFDFIDHWKALGYTPKQIKD